MPSSALTAIQPFLKGWKMLVQHRQALNEQITRLRGHEIKLDEKIQFYRNEIERVNNGFIEN